MALLQRGHFCVAKIYLLTLIFTSCDRIKATYVRFFIFLRVSLGIFICPTPSIGQRFYSPSLSNSHLFYGRINPMNTWILFFFGLFWGSFLNVVSLRWGNFKSILKGRSVCPNCQKTLGYFQLLPVLSFLIQSGKCKYCKERISLRYPLVEILTGAVLFFLFKNSLSFFSFASSIILFSLLIVISLYDLKTMVIPDGLVWTFNALAFLGIFLLAKSYPVGYLLSGLALFSFFAILWLVSKGAWMGFGDAKLALGVGFILGLDKGLLALILAFWVGTIFALGLLVFFRKTYSMKSKVPFGPFLALAAFISFIFGDKIIGWYLGS